MGVSVSREDDSGLYKEAYEEAQRIIRISDEVRISLEKIAPDADPNMEKSSKQEAISQLSTSKLAKKLGLKTNELTQKLVENGYLQIDNEETELTAIGSQVGEAKKGRFGSYFLWNSDLAVE